MKLPRLRDLLDPDRDWRNLATVQHYLFGIIFCAMLDWRLSTWAAFTLTTWTGAVYEAGQADATYSLKDSQGRRYAGQPGYGFSLMDEGAVALGALTWIAGRAGVRAVLGL